MQGIIYESVQGQDEVKDGEISSQLGLATLYSKVGPSKTVEDLERLTRGFVQSKRLFIGAAEGVRK
jgi:hypothetical protein